MYRKRLAKTMNKELWIACYKKDLNKVRMLLSYNADPCAKTDGVTAFHLSAYYYPDDSTDILQAIFSSGRVRDIDVRDEWNRTALMSACRSGNVECVKMLVKNGANVSLKNDSGDSILRICVRSGKPELVNECLTWAGVNMNEVGVNNKTPLISACEDGYAGVVDVLLTVGADYTLKDDFGHDALWYAKKDLKVAEVFLNHKMKTAKGVHRQTETVDTSCVLPAPANNENTNPFSFKGLIKKMIPILGRSRNLLTLEVHKNQVVSNTSSNVTSLTQIIEKLFPKFEDPKIKALLLTMQDVGIDFEDFDQKDLLLLEVSDFVKVLQPVQARKLIKTLKENCTIRESVIIGIF